ncbi:hypothetical protein [Desulfopila inferna]|uniref:hypothetical protein n=1 Tax=Desulfopila inferna TaxID=468528 RepID=UPI0019622ACB|nr:hypothetical protein [Desulfopila inferna]MBM9604950.1 hypothetical protein [Desulfopila inferna]
MSDYIIQINTFEIKEGKLEIFKASVKRSQEFAEENDPLLMAEMYIDEESMQARACLIHRDSESILAHWKTSEEYMIDVMEFCNPKRVDILGQPNDSVMERLLKYEEVGVPVTMTPHFAGFSRLKTKE